MPFNVLEAVLITVISVSLVALSFPWVMKAIGESMDTIEVSFIKSQFDTCSDRILETARTGTSNRCFFNINRGKLAGKTEGLSYTIVSSASICDPHPLTEIDDRKHIWQECREVDGQKVYEMLWMFPKELEVSGTGIQGSKMAGQSSSGSIGFDDPINFRTLSVYVGFEYKPDETGNVVDMSRVAITDEDVTLSIRLH